MREIKFRAFDVAENMTYFNLDGNALKRGVREQPLQSMLQQEEGYELMQYTGLKDKNGKEIYEGDIIRFYFDADNGYSDTSEDGDFTEMIDTVGFSKGAFMFVNNVVNASALARSHNKHSEIIGNIYENPELLDSH